MIDRTGLLIITAYAARFDASAPSSNTAGISVILLHNLSHLLLKSSAATNHLSPAPSLSPAQPFYRRNLLPTEPLSIAPPSDIQNKQPVINQLPPSNENAKAIKSPAPIAPGIQHHSLSNLTHDTQRIHRVKIYICIIG